jgi:thiol:disulfide interchange protein
MTYQLSGLALMSLIALNSFLGAENVCFFSKALSPSEHRITITLDVEPPRAILKNSIFFTIDNPLITLSPWEADKTAAALEEHQGAGYLGKTNFMLVAHSEQSEQPTVPATLVMHYRLNTVAQPQERLFIVDMSSTPIDQEIASDSDTLSACKLPASISEKDDRASHNSVVSRMMKSLQTTVQNIKHKLSNLVQKTESLPARLGVVLLLGLLMSLTPCIYPMIPITIGILQITPGQSLGRNFAIALFYTLGIGITFAILGLLAACGGAQFGQLLGNPIFVLFLVAFLGYLAFSMLGLYEMYIPRFLRSSGNKRYGGPLVSAFIFGAISGTMASPCLSPGLALVLTMVAGLGNRLLGFLLLFAFGVGSSIPLLLIGTFSSSLGLLPRAGSWMVEIKKLFGFLLLGMCLYYLANILPVYIVLTIMAIGLFVSGIYYSVIIASYDSRGMRYFKHSMSVIFVISSFLVGLWAYKARHQEAHDLVTWQTDYAVARQQAQEQNKKLLLDFGASWCTSCKILEKEILQTSSVAHVLARFVPVKIDCTNGCSKQVSELQQKYGVKGFPTIIAIDPHSQDLIKSWGSELMDGTPEQFAQQLQELA